MRSQRVSGRFAVAAVILAALVGVALGIGLHKLRSSGHVQPGMHFGLRGQAVWPAGLRRAPGFSLPDQSGRRFSLSSARGRPVVLTFMDSHCHQECPLEGRALSAALRLLPKGKLPLVVVVSVNPWADTPASARRAIERFGLASFDCLWLLGSRARLAPVWHRFGIGVRRAKGDIEHTDALYLIDTHGFERVGMVYPFLPTWLSTDLTALADGADRS
jgi:protein SCO1/2